MTYTGARLIQHPRMNLPEDDEMTKQTWFRFLQLIENPFQLADVGASFGLSPLVIPTASSASSSPPTGQKLTKAREQLSSFSIKLSRCSKL